MQFLQFIRAAFLLAIFITPVLSNSVHNIVHSHSNNCYETKIHIHEKHTDCKYQDYIPYIYDIIKAYISPTSYPNFIVIRSCVLVVGDYDSFLYFNSGRDPPFYG